MADDEMVPTKGTALAAEFVQEMVERDLRPYLDLIFRAMDRATKLVKVAIERRDKTSDEILRAVVVLNHASRGFGFVEMTNEAEAEKAIAALNGATLDGRSLNVNEARPKTDRPMGRPRRGRY